MSGFGGGDGNAGGGDFGGHGNSGDGWSGWWVELIRVVGGWVNDKYKTSFFDVLYIYIIFFHSFFVRVSHYTYPIFTRRYILVVLKI